MQQVDVFVFATIAGLMLIQLVIGFVDRVMSRRQRDRQEALHRKERQDLVDRLMAKSTVEYAQLQATRRSLPNNYYEQVNTTTKAEEPQDDETGDGLGMPVT